MQAKNTRGILPRDTFTLPRNENAGRRPQATPLESTSRALGYTFYSDMQASGVNLGKVMWVYASDSPTAQGSERGRVEPMKFGGPTGGAGRVIHNVSGPGGYGGSESTAGWVTGGGQVLKGRDRDKATLAGYRRADGAVFAVNNGRERKIGTASSNWAAAAMILLFRH